MENNLNFITNSQGDRQRIWFNIDISLMFHHFLDICIHFLFVWVWRYGDQWICCIQCCDWLLQMVFIANWYATNDCYIGGKSSARGDNSWIIKYPMYTNGFQKGKYRTHSSFLKRINMFSEKGFSKLFFWY